MSAPTVPPPAPHRLGVTTGPNPGRPGLVLSRRVAFPFRRRQALSALILAAVVVVLGLLSIRIGYNDLSFGRIIATILGSGSSEEQLIVDSRLPRLLGALLAGCALGAGGAITQSMTRNALASPDILGVTDGAGLGAALIFVFPGTFGALAALGVPLTAFTFGLATAGVILLLGSKGGQASMRLILAGIAIGALLQAGIAFTLLKADLDDAAQLTRWLVGGLGSVGYTEVAYLTVTVVGALTLTTIMSRNLALTRMDPSTAKSLGLNLGRAQLAALVISVLLVSVAAAACGPIGFVALVAPQIALRVMRSAGPPVLGGALVGAILLMASDFAVRFLPGSLPAGAITALIGAPYMVHLLRRAVRSTNA